MFKEMRRSDKQIEVEESINLLKTGEYGVLSTVGVNGYAYGVPLNYVYYEGNIYFHCALEGAKLDNIAINNKVSFCVVGSTESIPDKFSYRYMSTIVFGCCIDVSGKEKENALTELVKKYSGDFIEKGIEYIQKGIDKTKVLKIEIDYCSGKAQK